MDEKIIVDWYGILKFETIGIDLKNGWWYIMMNSEFGSDWHHIEAEYVSRIPEF